ncbi:MAG: response regulator, partial [Bdellovibrionales bacterium]|nr:response regulator [Bdellovibrionales bacterium]
MNSSKVSILIVDDDLQLLKALADMFLLLGFRVQTAENGLQAWGKIQEMSFDLVLSDVRMEQGSGVELLKKSKARNPDNPKFLLISGYADFALDDLYAMGVDGFFAKPFSASTIRQAIQENLL